MLFWILFGIDAIAAAVVIYFFVWGLMDGSVSSFNIVLWLGLLAALAAILGGGWFLHRSGKRGAASAVLAVLAAPAFLFGLFVLGLIVLQPRWN
jgi:hypothetical protein